MQNSADKNNKLNTECRNSHWTYIQKLYNFISDMCNPKISYYRLVVSYNVYLFQEIKLNVLFHGSSLQADSGNLHKLFAVIMNSTVSFIAIGSLVVRRFCFFLTHYL